MGRAIWTPQYDPIAYWVLDEKSGTVAYDMVSGRVAGAQNGAHTGVTLGQPGIGDGRTAPFYDGTNDFTNVHSAAFAAAFNGGEGSLSIWARVANAGVWTDGTQREIVRFAADGNNYLDLYRAPPNNRITMLYNAGGTLENVAIDGLTTVDWMHWVVTWSASAGVNGEVKVYLNGAQTGATQTALGVWVGALAAASTCIGAFSTVPAAVWNGYLDHCAVWDRPLLSTEVAGLAVIE
jgi:hypothetical protein